MKKNKAKQSLMAMMLSFIMVVGIMPVSALAETSIFPIGTSGEITVFKALGTDIASQSVPLGTSKADLQLPDVLTATVRLVTLEEKPVIDSGQADSGLDSAGKITILLPVTWTSSPEYDGEATGTYIFSPELPEGLILTDDVKLPAITVTVSENEAPVQPARGMFTLLSTGSGETQVLGLGTEEYPLRIETAAQLADFAWCLNNNALPTTLPEYLHLLLVNDIDLSAYGAEYESRKSWMSIGTDSNPFKGNFNGNGKAVTGLYINCSDMDNVGLFGYIRGGAVQNLALQDVSINGRNFVGGVVGFADSGSIIQNCAVTGSIRGQNHTGGIVGTVHGSTVKNCAASSSVTGTDLSLAVGGVAGAINFTTMQDCIAWGSINGHDRVGGVVGWVIDCTVQGCVALNPSISAISGDKGRIAGSIPSSHLSDNYAWSGITVNSATVSGSANGNHGVDTDNIALQTLWTTGPLNIWNSDLWTLTEGKLPVLTGLPGQSDTLPAYITGLEGAGTSESDPYRIYTAEDLKWLADQVNSLTGFAYGKFFRLENDIDLSAYGKDYDAGKGWTPIGCTGQFENAVFNGNGKTITGLYINRGNETNIGLFGSVMHGTIQNLFLEDIILRSDTNLLESNIGGLAGRVSGASTISGCASTGSVSVAGAVRCFIGGLIGILEQGSTADNCAFYGTVSAKAEVNPDCLGSAYAGGIAGQVYNGAAVTNCLSIATVDVASSSAYAGGIAGQVDAGAKIAQSAALGARVSSSHNAGRIVIIGSSASGDPMNQNYAWSGITVNSDTVSGLANGSHGADIDASALQTLWTTGPLNTWNSDLWKLSEGKLPVLKTLSDQSDALPAYIAGLEGAGTNESDPYRIYTAEDLKWLAEKVNGGDGFSGKYFRLENDIDLSAYGKGYDGSKGWMPIGITYVNSFKGNFNGNGKVVTGLYINRSDMDHVGLFGVVNMGSVESLILRYVSINAADKDCVGSIAGRIIESKVRRCAVSGNIKGHWYVGGIAGEAVATTTMIENCVSAANVEGSFYVGGIVGETSNSVMLNSCLSTGKVSGNSAVGGMVGDALNSCSIQNCVSTGSISGNFIGGIAGITTGSTNTLQNCAALSSYISATDSAYGRIVGNTASNNLSGNYAFSGMKVNGNTISGGMLNNKDGADANTTLLLRTSFWRDTLDFSEAIWSITEGRLPYLIAFPEYAPNLELTAYTFPASDSSNITLAADSALLMKSSEAQTVTLTATGIFKDTAWPDLAWETSVGSLIPAADTFSAVLTVPAGFTGSITVTAKPVRFPSLPGKSVTVTVNGDLEGTVNVIGTFRYGHMLTASPSITSTSPGMLSYQWMRDCNPIINANSIIYELTEEDLGEIVSVRVTAQNYVDKIQSVGQTVLRAENITIPVAPQFESKTQTSIALKAVDGYEYAILIAGSDIALLGLTDAFQSVNQFTGLTSGTSYDLYQRITGTATVEPSAFSEKLTVTTDRPERSPGGGSGSGGDTPPVTITSEKKPDQPIMATTPVTATARKNGVARVAISDKTITNVITKAQADAKAQGKTANGISIGLNVIMPMGATALTVTLTRSSLSSLVKAGVASLEINGSPVTITFDKKALVEIQKQSSGNVTITIKPAQNLSAAAKKLIGTRPVYDITVSYVKDGKSIVVSAFNGGIATISIPYKPGKNEAAGYLYGVYVDAKGKATRIKGSAYDANAGAILISTGHLSVYGIGYTAPSAKFTDIANHCGKESIDYVVGRRLLPGISKTTFAPDTAITCGMLVMALGKLAGVDAKAYTTNSFTDVKGDSAFRLYIEWAYKKGIVQGIGNQQFAPDRAITREEIAVIFANYAKTTGYKLPVTREATAYADTFSIGSVYKTAVSAMQQAGIMMGGTGNKFNPKSNATRAEVSAMLHRYIKLTIDPSTAQGWALNDVGQWLYYKDGKALTGTQTIDGVKYFFETTGVLKTGWVKDGLTMSDK